MRVRFPVLGRRDFLPRRVKAHKICQKNVMIFRPEHQRTLWSGAEASNELDRNVLAGSMDLWLAQRSWKSTMREEKRTSIVEYWHTWLEKGTDERTVVRIRSLCQFAQAEKYEYVSSSRASTLAAKLKLFSNKPMSSRIYESLSLFRQNHRGIIKPKAKVQQSGKIVPSSNLVVALENSFAPFRI